VKGRPPSVPDSVIKLIRKTFDMRRKYREKIAELPSDDDLANRAKVSISTVKAIGNRVIYRSVK